VVVEKGESSDHVLVGTHLLAMDERHSLATSRVFNYS
jgi:hypothetical protein